MNSIQEQIAKTGKMVSVVLFAACVLTVFAIVSFIGGLGLVSFSNGELSTSLFEYLQADYHLRTGAGMFASRRELAMLFIYGIGQLMIIFSVLLILYRIFKDISRSYTPFEKIQVVRMKWVAKLILALGIISSFCDRIAMFSDYGTILMDLNIVWIVMAMVIYCMAHIFDYGYQLQTQSDETL